MRFCFEARITENHVRLTPEQVEASIEEARICSKKLVGQDLAGKVSRNISVSQFFFGKAHHLSLLPASHDSQLLASCAGSCSSSPE